MFSRIGVARGRWFAGSRAFRIVSITDDSQSLQLQGGAKRYFSKKLKSNTHDVLVTCLPGLEPLVSQELHAFKILNTITPGGVIVRDMTTENILKCHLYLGCASHVYIRCGEPFEVRGFPELLKKVNRFPWEDVIPPSVTQFDFRVTSSKSKLTHTGAIAERVENGIKKRLGTPKHPIATSTPAEKVTIVVRIVRDTVTVSLDTSSTPIHQRGYRLETAKAPLREDIAFAMLYGAGLRPEYHENEKIDGFTGLVDPFCGSGTIAIEGAAMMVGLPPGRLREAPLKGTLFYNPDHWTSLVAQSVKDATNRELDLKPLPRILATDRDEGAIESTTNNAQRAGVLKYIDIQTTVLANNPWILKPENAPMDLLMATNPPYGRRVSFSKTGKEVKSRIHLLPLYQSIGHKLMNNLAAPGRHLAAVILNHNVEMVRRTALPSLHANFTTSHGGLPVAAMFSPSITPKQDTEKQARGVETVPEEAKDKVHAIDESPPDEVAVAK